MLTNKLHGCSTAWRVLITDAYGLKVVSSCARMSDLAEVGVSGTSRCIHAWIENANALFQPTQTQTDVETNHAYSYSFDRTQWLKIWKCNARRNRAWMGFTL